MDRRVTLLGAFGRHMVPGVVKIEAEQHGIAFLERLLSHGSSLDYGELTPLRLVHRYRLSNVSDEGMSALLRAHVDQELNVCRYFHPVANDTFCFNLDNNRTVDATADPPEVQRAVDGLRRALAAVGCAPFVVQSGRGHHAWCRLREPTANAALHDFMLHIAARALRAVHDAGFDHERVKINLYPCEAHVSAVSLRLFGSRHVKTGRFSHVSTPDGPLDEAASWEAFEEFMGRRALSPGDLEAARAAMAADV